MNEVTGQANIIGSLLPLVVLFAIFYFLVIRPQQQQVKKHKAMLESLSKGDKVVTNGGLIVEIVKVEENFYKVKLDNNSEAKLDKQSVLRKVNED
jgi:preprotein translocase subunit YajC